MRFFFLSILLLCCTFSFSQNPDDKFDLNNLNIPYLEHLTKLKIDSVRNGQGLRPLYNDSILYIAAGDHSRYLTEKELSHFQPENPEKENPQKRATFYGAVNYLTGENIARTVLNGTVSHKLKDQPGKKLTFSVHTYNLAAYSLAVSWVNSPPHYANIITPGYDATGMSISFDPKTNQVTAVQKFATILYKYAFSNTGVLFPYASEIPPAFQDIKDVSNIPVRKDYPWKLKPGTPEDFNKVKSIFLGGASNDRFYRDGDDQHLVTYKIYAMRQLLKRRKDGFAIEQVQYEPFHCGNPDYYQLPSRRNDKYIFNGHVIKPVYKKSIMADFKKQTKEIKKSKKERIRNIKNVPKMTDEEREEKINAIKEESKYPPSMDVVIGTYSKADPGGYTEMNLIVIQKRRAAYVVHYSSVCDTASLYGKPVCLFPKFDSIRIADFVNTKKIQIKVPFERNAYEISEAQVKTIRDSVSSNLKMTAIHIEAWASVEGFEKINLDLQQKRAATMRNITAPFETDTTIKVSIKTGENWDMFYRQIKGTEFHSWAKLTKDSVKKNLEVEKNLIAFHEHLNAQRKSELKIEYEESIGVNSSAAIALGVLRSYITKIDNFPPRSIDPLSVQAATKMQKYIYDRYLKGEVSLQTIADIKIPHEKRFIPLLVNKLWFDYTYAYANVEPSKLPRDFYRLLGFCANDKTADITAKYNYCAFLVNAWKDKPFPGSPSIGDLWKLIDQLRTSLGKTLEPTSVTPQHIDSLKFDFNLKCIDHYAKNGDYKSLNIMLNAISVYYHKQQLTDSMTYVVGSFFNRFRRYDLASGILSPKVFVENPDLKILTLYLKITYGHVEEIDDFSFYDLLLDSYYKMPAGHWCDLFVGPCNISFQVFDHEKLRDFYCEKCADRGNHATRTMGSK